MNTVIDKKPITQVFNKIESFEKEQLNLKNQIKVIQDDLNNILKHSSLNAKATDELRDIQCIVDEIKKIDLSIKINLHGQIKIAIDKINQAISKIKVFQTQYGYQELIPTQVFDDIQEAINNCNNQLNSFEEVLNFILKSVKPVNLINVNLEKNSNKDTLKIWAEAIEILAEGLEELVNFCPEIQLGILEDLAAQLLLITAKSNSSMTKREGFRKRIRYAATFILNTVKKKKLELLNKNSAEAKAIERLENSEEIEWIPVLEVEQDINIDKIHARLKQRGYKIKLSCKD